ncbi:MAG: hypothetical protein ACI8RZ_002440 [Myxococcota bacterium]|jgi:hypothetical protein
MSAISALTALPTTGLTVSALNTLDTFVPGEWSNVTRFEDIVAEICGPDAPPKLLAQVGLVAKRIEVTDGARFDRAIQIYTLVDTADQVAAGAAVAGKIGAMFGGLSFLQKLTPKPDTTQALDAGVKLIAELLAFGTLHGMPSTDPDGLARFTAALADYARYDLMRIVAWVVFEGMIPLGPDFLSQILTTWKGLATSALSSNPVFRQLGDQLPGDTLDAKRGYIVDALDATGDWVGRFVEEKGITQAGAIDKLQGVLGGAAGGMDYIAAAIDASTAYFSHTGTQTVARALARQAHTQLREDVWKQHLATMR